jgi:sRNA-binding regulator protein Hfq
MKNFVTILIILFAGVVQAQSDKIYKYSGQTIDGKVLRVDEYTIIYKYDGEDAENTISKYAIEKIVYGKSGRVEEVTEKIEINNKEDWEKVIILEEKSYIAGLKKGEDVRGKTGLINYHSGNSGDKKAEKKLKMDAAEKGYPFILMTDDKSTVGASSNGLGGFSANKKRNSIVVENILQ